MNAEQLKQILEEHSLWLAGDDSGKRASLQNADLTGAYLARADLRDADLRGADLPGADLTGAYLAGAELVYANLAGANLRGANLASADLRGAELASANLASANLRGANLRGANLRGANLRGADLRGAAVGGEEVSTEGDREVAIAHLMECGFLGDRDPEFRAFVERMPDTHWAKYDLSAMRLGWEAYKTLHTETHFGVRLPVTKWRPDSGTAPTGASGYRGNRAVAPERDYFFLGLPERRPQPDATVAHTVVFEKTIGLKKGKH